MPIFQNLNETINIVISLQACSFVRQDWGIVLISSIILLRNQKIGTQHVHAMFRNNLAYDISYFTGDMEFLR